MSADRRRGTVDRREVWKVCDKRRTAGRKVTYRAVQGALEDSGSFRF